MLLVATILRTFCLMFNQRLEVVHIKGAGNCLVAVALAVLGLIPTDCDLF